MTDINHIDSTQKKEQIKKQSVFKLLTDQEIDELAELFIEKHFVAGDTIVKEGDLVDSVYLILSGTAEVQHIWIDKNEQKQTDSVTTLGPNDAIGLSETGFFSISGLRTATVVAKTNMVVLYLSMAAFHGFTLSHHRVNEVMRKHAESIFGVKS